MGSNIFLNQIGMFPMDSDEKVITQNL